MRFEEWIELLPQYVRGDITIEEHRVESLFQSIREHLKALNIENDNKIEQILNELRHKNKAYTRLIKGEPTDIIDENDNIIGKTEAGLAHLFRLRHRTSNAFVFSPDGQLVLQRRVHNKRFPLCLTIYGGHVIPPKSYKETIQEEIREELKLSNPLSGKFLTYNGNELVYREPYDISTDNNLEIRALYLYELTAQEWNEVQTFREKLVQHKSKKLPKDFASWIEKEQKAKSGYGEVWGVELFTLENIKQASEGVTWVSEIDSVAQVHFLKLQSNYAGIVSEDVAYFTPDLLDRFVRNKEVIRILDEVHQEHYWKKPA